MSSGVSVAVRLDAQAEAGRLVVEENHVPRSPGRTAPLGRQPLAPKLGLLRPMMRKLRAVSRRSW